MKDSKSYENVKSVIEGKLTIYKRKDTDSNNYYARGRFPPLPGYETWSTKTTDASAASRSAMAKYDALRQELQPLCKAKYAEQREKAQERIRKKREKALPKKLCKTCKETKPLSRFYKHGATRDRRTSECRDCRLKAQKVRDATNLKKRIQKQRKRRRNKPAAIYVILNKAIDKPYVGQSTVPMERKSQHEVALRTGKHHNAALQGDYNKYGEKNFEFKVVEALPPNTSEKTLLRKELLKIAEYLRQGKDTYNL